MSAGRATVALAVALAVSLGFGRPVAWTLALVGDTETVASTLSTETLDPPTSVSATTVLLVTVNVTWVPTVDTRATGYQIWRSTTSGSGYVQVGTVTPQSATSFSEVVLPGTYYYVVRSYFASWTSVNSNEDAS